MKIGDRIFVHGYIDEIRKDTIIVRNDGGYFETVPSEVITGELPSAQLGANLAEVGTDCSEFPNNSDAISRLAAIDT